MTQSRALGRGVRSRRAGASPRVRRGGGTAPTFPASGQVQGAEPPELPPSFLLPRPAQRGTILAGSGSRAERLVSVEAGVSASDRGRSWRHLPNKKAGGGGEDQRWRSRGQVAGMRSSR